MEDIVNEEVVIEPDNPDNEITYPDQENTNEIIQEPARVGLVCGIYGQC